MRSQRSGRGRFGIRGRRREERRAKVEVWSSGDGRGEREAGRALGCLGLDQQCSDRVCVLSCFYTP